MCVGQSSRQRVIAPRAQRGQVRNERGQVPYECGTQSQPGRYRYLTNVDPKSGQVPYLTNADLKHGQVPHECRFETRPGTCPTNADLKHSQVVPYECRFETRPGTCPTNADWKHCLLGADHTLIQVMRSRFFFGWLQAFTIPPVSSHFFLILKSPKVSALQRQRLGRAGSNQKARPHCPH